MLFSLVLNTCLVCGNIATEYCKDCAYRFGWDIAHTYLCPKCWQLVHSHPKREHHAPPNSDKTSYPQSYVQERVTMELFAVVCINTSHYVSFVKCGSGVDESWAFFDSMADRRGM